MAGTVKLQGISGYLATLKTPKQKGIDMRHRSVGIHPEWRGFRVEVGCQSIVYANTEIKELIKDLEEYLNNPGEKQMEMEARYGNKSKSYTLMSAEDMDQCQEEESNA
jgi:hypothetical protein